MIAWSTPGSWYRRRSRRSHKTLSTRSCKRLESPSPGWHKWWARSRIPSLLRKTSSHTWPLSPFARKTERFRAQPFSGIQVDSYNTTSGSSHFLYPLIRMVLDNEGFFCNIFANGKRLWRDSEPRDMLHTCIGLSQTWSWCKGSNRHRSWEDRSHQPEPEML